MTIKELITKWNKEKESYSKQEVGSGVQKFIKDVLKSEEIFGLKEGLISTHFENRKNEFIEESKTKAARHADIVIFVNQDIKMPVEVEKLGNLPISKISFGNANEIKKMCKKNKYYRIIKKNVEKQ